jgi:hypothetical protein
VGSIARAHVKRLFVGILVLVISACMNACGKARQFYI